MHLNQGLGEVSISSVRREKNLGNNSEADYQASASSGDSSSTEINLEYSEDNETISTEHRQKSPENPSPLDCYACGGSILEDFLLLMNGQYWHENCLRCQECSRVLNEDEKCYIRDGGIFCREDYIRRYASECAKCQLQLMPTDWVRKAKGYIFHLACFACDVCAYQLSTGDEFGIQEKRVLCKQHYQQQQTNCMSDSDSSPVAENINNKRKRMRTTFTDQQLKLLKKKFDLETNPGGEQLAKIAQEAGLSKRVTQVWFQNARARVRHRRSQRHPLC